MKCKNHQTLPGRLSVLIILLFSLTVLFLGCQESLQIPTEPVDMDQGAVLDLSKPQLQKLKSIQEKHTSEMMLNKDIIGTAIGADENGKAVIKVYVNYESNTFSKSAADVPAVLDEIPVVIEFTEPFKALKGKPQPPPDDGMDHKDKQIPPIALGTSGGWRYDLANGYCCGGTLGALIQTGGKKYILSNYHVFEADIVAGGNNRVATTGDPIIQPGLIDVGCNATNAQNVATLVVSSSLPASNVDASTAAIITGMVDESGAILEIGTLSSSTVAASINQKVKKSGRTTGLTRSKVNGLNATVSVTYDNECAGGVAFTKTFTGQIIILNRGSKFLAAGDSGSLMVEDEDTNPGAVGLLFAGSSTLAVANPIADVLLFFSATMVGN
jgi:hypothetical protein